MGQLGSERGLSRPDPVFEHDPQHRDWRLTTVVFLESTSFSSTIALYESWKLLRQPSVL
jgi:hypothetical protein